MCRKITYSVFKWSNGETTPKINFITALPPKKVYIFINILYFVIVLIQMRVLQEFSSLEEWNMNEEILLLKKIYKT